MPRFKTTPEGLSTKAKEPRVIFDSATTLAAVAKGKKGTVIPVSGFDSAVAADAAVVVASTLGPGSDG